MRPLLFQGALPRIALIGIVLAFPASARAQELSALAGGHDADTSAHAWEVDYRLELLPHFGASASWLNEGHVSNVGHRDGLALQLWGETPRFHGFALSAEAGLYSFFETEISATGSFMQEHDFVPVAGFSATYRRRSPWMVRFVLNQIDPLRDTRTTTYLLGAGYRFDAGAESTPGPETPSASAAAAFASGLRSASELTLLAGMASTNSDKSQSAPALGLEYRYRAARFWEGALSYLNEGDTKISRRQGLVAQAVLMQEVLRGRLTVGLGAGGYWAVDRPVGESSRGELNGVLTLNAALRYGSHGLVRIGLVRILTDHDRDSDVIQVGVGYRFGPCGP